MKPLNDRKISPWKYLWLKDIEDAMDEYWGDSIELLTKEECYGGGYITTKYLIKKKHDIIIKIQDMISMFVHAPKEAVRVKGSIFLTDDFDAYQHLSFTPYYVFHRTRPIYYFDDVKTSEHLDKEKLVHNFKLLDEIMRMLDAGEL
jgi:hypothetical protein